jgi:hypothetical protein
MDKLSIKKNHMGWSGKRANIHEEGNKHWNLEHTTEIIV